LAGQNLLCFFKHLPGSIGIYKPPASYFEFEVELAQADAENRHASINVGIFPAEHSDGQEPVNLVFMRDTSLQRQAEEQLTRASRHYWSLFEASSDAIFLELEDGTIFDCNKSCERMYGYSKSELLNMNARDLVPGSSLTIIEGLIPELDAMKATQSGIQLEAVGRRKDGSLFPSEVLVNFVKVNGEECFAVTIRDISSRREIESSRQRYESQVMQLQKLDHLGQMANGLANDFNNLLTGIMGYSDLILRELPEESTSREKARRIVDAARKASDIIQQLMAYSGKLPTLYQKTSLKVLLRELQPVFRQIAGEGIDLRHAVDEDLPEIQLDPPMLKQALINIVKNSVEALDKNRPGEISITAFPGLCNYYGSEPGYFGPPVKPGSYLVIKVSDNGTGIEPENLNRIFDPFYSTRYAGRGLGLSSVIGMLRSHRGAVMVTSTPGHGTDFAIFLPVDASASMGEGNTVRHAEESYPAGCALVIDDDENVREILADNIRMLGYEVFVAENGKEGIEVFKSQQRRLNIVLTDLVMPGMNGIEVIKEIRWMNPEIPVIVCTGIGSDEKGPELEKLGVSAVLEKPFSYKDLEKHFTRIQLKARNRNNTSDGGNGH
jgi:PAS domain S-box-containing protein